MIRRKLNGGWLIVTQPDHARLAGDLARHWGNDEFPSPKPVEEVLLAVKEHDNGWREIDALARLNPDNGLPYNFSEWPLPDHFPIWQRAEKHLLDSSPYAALLISRHGSILFRYLVDGAADPLLAHPFFTHETWRSRGDDLSEEEQKQIWAFVGERESFQSGVRETLNSRPATATLVSTERFNADFRLLQTCDALSLYAVLEPPRKKILHNIARREWGDFVTLQLRPAGESSAIIDPYPFDVSPLCVEISGRRLPAGPFKDQEDLNQTWRAENSQTLTFTYFRPE